MLGCPTLQPANAMQDITAAHNVCIERSRHRIGFSETVCPRNETQSSTNWKQDISLAFTIMVYPSNAIYTGRGGKKKHFGRQMAHPKTNPMTECRYVGSRYMAQIHCQVPRYATRSNASSDCTSIRSHLPSLFNAHLRPTVVMAESRSPLRCLLCPLHGHARPRQKHADSLSHRMCVFAASCRCCRSFPRRHPFTAHISAYPITGIYSSNG